MRRFARRPLVRLASLALALLGAPASLAAVTCSVAASGVVFGIYSPLNAAPLNSTGTITVTCTLLSGGATTVNLTATLSTGTSGSFASRTMLAGASKLNYNLYWSNAYAQVWGDGTGGSFAGFGSLQVTPGNPTQQIGGTMYGQIGSGQDVAPGAYADTIVVTVSY